MTYRYIYKITCTAGSFKGKFYFGQHTTDNLDDGYKGCGILINKYYKKHPNDYIKEIIAFYDTQEELNQAEYDIIHPFLDNEMCLNLCEGGKGGYIPHIVTEESKNKTSKSLYRYYETHDGPNKGKKMSNESNKKRSEKLKGKPTWNKNLPKELQPFYGKNHSEESKQKNRINHIGKKSSPEAIQKRREIIRRRKWLTRNNEKPIYVDIDDVNYYLSLGYHPGRK